MNTHHPHRFITRMIDQLTAQGQFMPCALAFLGLLGLGASAQAVTFDFTSQSVYDSNFYTVGVSSGSTLSVNTDVDMLEHYRLSGGGAAAWVYDTSPDGTPTDYSYSNFTVEMDFMVEDASTAIAFYLYDGGVRNAANQVFVQLSIGTGTNNDYFKYFYGADMSQATAGVKGTELYQDTLSNGEYTTGTLYHLSVTATVIDEDSVSIAVTLSDPSGTLEPFTSSYTIDGVAYTYGEIAFYSKVGAADSSNYFNNITITVPEPSVAAYAGLMGGVILLLAWLRRRR